MIFLKIFRYNQDEKYCIYALEVRFEASDDDFDIDDIFGVRYCKQGEYDVVQTDNREENSERNSKRERIKGKTKKKRKIKGNEKEKVYQYVVKKSQWTTQKFL